MARFNKKHGMSNTQTYKAWMDMKTRCYSKNAANYKYYGGRGVKVCSEWLESFENFYKDMGEAPEGASLSREGDVGDYEPKNCSWKSRSESSSEVLRGERNAKAKLTEEQVHCLRSLQKGSNPKYFRAPLLAQELKTSRQSINNILQRRTWTHI
jgi:hypothetical protein